MTTSGRTLRDVWDGLRSQPGKTGLALLAISVGMMALTLLLATLGGLQERARRLIEEFGVNAFAVVGAAPSGRGYLGLQHAELLRANLAGARVSVTKRYAPDPTDPVQDISVFATDEALSSVRGWEPVSGRWLDAYDLRNRERVAVVTEAAARRYGWEPGRTVVIKGTSFAVSGVVRMGAGVGSAGELDRRVSTGEMAIFVPLTVAMAWDGWDPAARRRVDVVFVRVDGTGIERSLPLAQRILGGADARMGDGNWVTPDVLLAGVRRLQNMILYSVGSIAVMCLILGGTTLMSLMVVNVRERIPEIGLRRALGATGRDVAVLFVCEGVFVSLTGSVCGVLVAHTALGLTLSGLPFPVQLSLGTFLMPVVVSLLMGAVASYGPARLAAGIAPAEALRAE